VAVNPVDPHEEGFIRRRADEGCPEITPELLFVFEALSRLVKFEVLKVVPPQLVRRSPLRRTGVLMSKEPDLGKREL
jgi:hypothetical protein